MSSFAGDGDSLGQEGRGKTLNIGKSFIKRIAYRIRGGAATPETNAAPEEPSNDFVLDVERDRAAPSEPKAIPTSVRYVESNVSEILPQPGSNANLIIPIKYVRGADRHERTRRLLAKYGLSVEAQDWMPAISNYPATVLRVEKQIRMRVRFTCHLCEHIFGANRNCKTCNHKRCEACPRHPSKRRLESKSREETDRENLTKTNLAKENLTITTDVVSTRKREHEEMESLTRSRSRGKMQASEDAPIPVMQSLQHSCHKCNMTFEQRGRLCASCGHIRCSRCPRSLADCSGKGEDPLRPERVHRPPRQRIRWICDHCGNTFTEGSKVCSECLHKRCQACRRIPPKRLKIDHEENKETIQERVRVPIIR